MKAAKGQIARLLDQPSPDTRFYLFWGPDEGQSRALALRLLQSLGADRFMVISNHVKSDPASLADEAGALALFGGRRVIWIEPAGDEIREGISALLAAPVVESPVVAIASSGSRPSELVKMAEASPVAVAFAAYAPEGKDAERMIIDVARRFGLNVSGPVAARLATACGNDQAIAARELEKLALYLDASTSRPRELDHDAIDAIGADLEESDLAGLADFSLGGDLQATADLLAQAGGTADAIPVIRALQRRLQMLAGARSKVERGDRPDAVMASLGKALFWKDKASFGAMLSRWTSSDLARLLERSADAEREILFGNAPPLDVLGEEALAIARAARRR